MNELVDKVDEHAYSLLQSELPSSLAGDVPYSTVKYTNDTEAVVPNAAGRPSVDAVNAHIAHTLFDDEGEGEGVRSGVIDSMLRSHDTPGYGNSYAGTRWYVFGINVDCFNLTETFY